MKMYTPRLYRDLGGRKDLASFEVMVRETDLYILAHKNLEDEALSSILKHRRVLEDYATKNPVFLTTLEPFKAEGNVPDLIREMIDTSARAGVGPMATVAGAIAEFVGRDLLKYSPEIVIENGGDIFLKTQKKMRIGISAGDSIFTGRLALEIEPEDTPLGVCTSSGTVSHSLSFGKADAVAAVSKSASLADAAATAIGNIIKDREDIPAGIELAKKMDGLKGVVIIKQDKIGIWGGIKISRT